MIIVSIIDIMTRNRADPCGRRVESVVRLEYKSEETENISLSAAITSRTN